MKKRQQHILNERIYGDEIRLIGNNLEKFNLIPAIHNKIEILNIAEEHEVDLILITSGKPPICKLDRYKDFLYKERKNNKQKKTPSDKEIKIGIDTQENDLNRFKRDTLKFLGKGHNVRITMQIRGKDMKRKDQGEMKMLQFLKMLEGECKISELPKLKGNRYVVNVQKKK